MPGPFSWCASDICPVRATRCPALLRSIRSRARADAASSAPKILEALRRQLGVADRVLNVAVAQIGLQCPGIVALVGQREPAGVAQYVRMGLEAQLCGFPGALDHAGKSRGGERGAAFRGEHERRFVLLIALQPAQCAQLIAAQWLRARRALLGPADRQGSVVEVDLVPTKVDQFGSPQVSKTMIAFRRP
jgi:hypothetical protein